MRSLSKAALATLLGTILLPPTALSGMEVVDTNPASLDLDDETTDSEPDTDDEDPFTDAGAEVDDMDETEQDDTEGGN